jgi:hemolysin activation/secretion protein
MDSPDALVSDTAGANARGGFWLASLQVQRDQPLPREWQLQLNLSAQMASHSLDGSEKFYLGGSYGVMSAPIDADGGEAGALLGANLSHAIARPFGGELRGALLLQDGKVWQRPTATSGAISSDLAGAGLGMDYQWKQTLSVHLAYVHGVGSNRTSSGARVGGQWWIGFNADL